MNLLPFLISQCGAIHITKSGSPIYDTTLSDKYINYIKDFLIPLHVILNYGMKSKASSDFQRV